MAPKGKNKPKNSSALLKSSSSKKQSKGKAVESNEDIVASNKLKQQANRAKVTSTSSWTGKLPHNLLHEACQKRKWNKVEYDMKKIGDKGMLAIVVISWTNPKTKEVLTIRLNDPTYDKVSNKGLLVPQETPMEARNYAATVALYRISYNNNLHMMLPPNHKKLWYYLSDYRSELLKQNASRADRLFDTDPFKSLLEERKIKEKRLKENEARNNQAEKEIKAPVIVSLSEKELKSNQQKASKTAKQRGSTVSFPRKVWENAPFIDFDESSRQKIETSLKKYINWQHKRIKPEDVTSSDRQILKQKLLSFRFRAPHVEEAMNYKDPIAFLLFNLPEDDLPEFFHKRREDSKTVVEISSLPLSTRNSIDRLVESGVSKDEAWFSLHSSDMDENEAARKLLEVICPELPARQEQLISEEESIEIWNEELCSLQSIYENKVEIIKPNSCYMMDLMDKFKLKLKIYRTKNYPSTLPGIIVSTFDKKYKLPDYIKQQILSRLLHYLSDNGMLGDMLAFHIYEWLQENIEEIIKNPGPLLSEEETNNLLNNSDEQTKSNKNSGIEMRRGRRYGSPTLNSEDQKALENRYLQRKNSAKALTMQGIRSKLPAWKKQDLIIELVENNDVVLITGETGSGKSTQVVQFILDYLQGKKNDFCQTNIICTQPRRISAIGLAERVSDERCVECGDEVGYIIRGVNNTNRLTRIKFMTTGVLVRMLQSDRSMLKNTIVVIDEVHERSIDTDLVVVILKNLIGKVPGLKIVLMSATVDVKTFESFFPNLGRCHIEGRTFPIKDYFLEDILETLDFTIKIDNYRDYSGEETDIKEVKPGADSRFFKSGQINYDLIRQLVNYIDEELRHQKDDGSVIIFLPGVAEINRCCKMISDGQSSDHFEVLPLHSALTPDDQRRVFKKYGRKRKVIVSTNIAETSITIDDCVAIIDSGRSKTMLYNPRDNTTRLVENFISKAEAKQRRGRAGRVREGLCYKLYSRRLYEEDMISVPAPEIKRVSLESLYLSVKAMGIKDVKGFLANGLDPPPLKALEKASSMLTTIGLLNEFDSSLTELGKFISLMPVMDSKHGKLLIYSNIFGVSHLGILIASIMSIGTSPFIGGFDNRDEVKSILSKYENRGDLLATTEIINQYFSLGNKALKNKFMKDNLLSYNKLRDIASAREQFYSVLKDVGFMPMKEDISVNKYLNRNENNIDILKAVLTGAFYPHVARVQLPDTKYLATSVGAIEKDADAKAVKYWIRNEEYIDKLQNKSDEKDQIEYLPATRAFIHPSSVLFSPNENNTREIKTLNEEDHLQHNTNKVKTILKSSFVVFNSSQVTSKLYLRDITPTSTLALLLLGGPISYDVNGDKHSPGIILDNWLAIRTWCKNGVLIKELRLLLDEAIKDKLGSPQYASKSDTTSKARNILNVVENMICIE